MVRIENVVDVEVVSNYYKFLLRQNEYSYRKHTQNLHSWNEYNMHFVSYSYVSTRYRSDGKDSDDNI